MSNTFGTHTIMADQFSIIAEFHAHKIKAWQLTDCRHWHIIARTGLAEFTPIHVLYQRSTIQVPHFLELDVIEGAVGLFAVKTTNSQNEPVVLLFTPKELRELLVEKAGTMGRPTKHLPITDDVVRIGTDRWGKIKGASL